MELEALIREAQSDEKAFRVLYDATVDKVFAYLSVRLRNKDATNDVLQEVYISLWKSIGRFRYHSDDHFYGFLFTIVKRRLYRYRNSQHETLPLEEWYDVADDTTPPEDYRAVMASLATLSPKERHVIELRYFSDLRFKDIAAMLLITENYAKVIHTRAIKKLSAQLSEYE